MARKKASFSNDLVHFWNQITGQNLGSPPSYSSLVNAILNKGASYPGQSNPNGYVSTSGLRDIPSAPSSTTVRKPKGITASSIFSAVGSELSRSSSSSSVGSGSSSGSSSIPASVPNYLNADLARHYGMDAATAYQEALANTAHQREVKDLVDAGLNPVLSSRYGGSSGVSGASVYAPADVVAPGSTSAKSVSNVSVIADLASGIVGLATGSNAKSNATHNIVNALGNVVENLVQSRD